MSPGTPTSPEYLKALVYIPPSTVVSELPYAHAPLAEIVQSFIVNVGLHTKNRWERVGRSHLNWNFKASSGRRTLPSPLPVLSQPIPSPVHSGSSVYVFHGRAFSSYEASVASVASNAAAPSTTTSTLVTLPGGSSDDMYDDDSDDEMYKVDDVSSSFVAAFDIANWEVERRGYEEREKSHKHQIHMLENEVKRLHNELEQLRSQSSRATAGSPPILLRSPFAETKSPVALIPSPVVPALTSLSFAPASALFSPTPLAPPPSPFSAPSRKTATPVRKRAKEDSDSVATPIKVKSPKVTQFKTNKVCFIVILFLND
jgi:hypothetical protein